MNLKYKIFQLNKKKIFLKEIGLSIRRAQRKIHIKKDWETCFFPFLNKKQKKELSPYGLIEKKVLGKIALQSNQNTPKHRTKTKAFQEKRGVSAFERGNDMIKYRPKTWKYLKKRGGKSPLKPKIQKYLKRKALQTHKKIKNSFYFSENILSLKEKGEAMPPIFAKEYQTAKRMSLLNRNKAVSKTLFLKRRTISKKQIPKRKNFPRGSTFLETAWYFHKAGAVPGGNFRLSHGYNLRNKTTHKLKAAYKFFSDFLSLGRLPKKKRVALFSSLSRKNQNTFSPQSRACFAQTNESFFPLILRDSLSRITFQKSFVEKREKKSVSHFYSSFLNGLKIKKKKDLFLLKDADFCIHISCLKKKRNV